MTKQQSARLWVAVHPDGTIQHRTVSMLPALTRKIAVERRFPPNVGWKQLYRRGWRIKRARVVVEG